MSNDITRLARGGLATRKTVTPEQQNAKMREVAETYEKHFLREMVKAMRSTVSDSSLIPTNQAEKIFKEQLDEQYVDAWGKRGGVGLADMIHEQLLNRFGEQMGIRAPSERPRGPVAIDAKTQAQLRDGATSSAMGFRTQSSASDKSVQISISDADQLSREVTPPWSGILSRIEKTDSGSNLLGVDHGNGFRSVLEFQGETTAQLQPGPVEAGQVLGNWDSGRGEMKWSLEYRPDSLAE